MLKTMPTKDIFTTLEFATVLTSIDIQPTNDYWAVHFNIPKDKSKPVVFE
jgi:hypothetical protein